MPLTLPVAAPGAETPIATRTLSAPSSSKEGVFEARSAFPRRMPARQLLSRLPRMRARHRAPGFATRTGFRRSFALRYDEEELDPAASASSSLASARRHAPLVDFCNRNEPQARPADR